MFISEKLEDDITFRGFTPETERMACAWLADPNIYKWLDFGNGKQCLGQGPLLIFLRSSSNFFRVCYDSQGRPFQFFCLQGYKSIFRSATLWAIRGRMRPPIRSRGTDNLIKMLQIAFGDLALKSVSAWAVECNRLSIMGMKKVGFREIGRQRQCHIINGKFYDRIHFDITIEDFSFLYPNLSLTERERVQ